MAKENQISQGPTGPERYQHLGNKSGDENELQTQNLINDFVRHPYGYPATLNFLHRFINDPQAPLLRENPRFIQIVLRYYSTPLSLKDVGKEFGVTATRIRNIIEETFNNLSENYPIDIRYSSDRQGLPMAKPYHVNRLLNKHGIPDANCLLSYIRPGITLPELVQATSVPKNALRYLIRKLRTNGVDVTLDRPSRYSNIYNRLIDSTSSNEKRRIFSEATPEWYFSLTRRKQPAIISLMKAANNIHYPSYMTAVVAELLQKAGIPVGKVTFKKYRSSCYFIHINDLKKARSIIETDSSFDRFRGNQDHH